MLEEFSVKAIKRILFIFNLFFAMTGLVLVIVGLVIKSYFVEYEPFIDDRYFSASSLLITSGSIIFGISFFGFCGALRENRCMVLTFSILLTVILILEFACGVTGYVLAAQTKQLLDAKLHDTMKQYKNSSDVGIWDTVQRQFECCGIDSSQDWIDAGHDIPTSCCKNSNVSCSGENIFKVGCSAKLTDLVKLNIKMLGGVAFAIIVTQFLGILGACYLGRYIKKSNYETV